MTNLRDFPSPMAATADLIRQFSSNAAILEQHAIDKQIELEKVAIQAGVELEYEAEAEAEECPTPETCAAEGCQAETKCDDDAEKMAFYDKLDKVADDFITAVTNVTAEAPESLQDVAKSMSEDIRKLSQMSEMKRGITEELRRRSADKSRAAMFPPGATPIKQEDLQGVLNDLGLTGGESDAKVLGDGVVGIRVAVGPGEDASAVARGVAEKLSDMVSQRMQQKQQQQEDPQCGVEQHGSSSGS